LILLEHALSFVWTRTAHAHYAILGQYNHMTMTHECSMVSLIRRTAISRGRSRDKAGGGAVSFVVASEGDEALPASWRKVVSNDRS
jgi:hypothetical protein